MILRDLKTIALVGSLAMLSACTINGGGDDGNDDTGTATDNPSTGNPTTTPTTSGADTGGEDAQLCANFGGYAGVKTVVGDFVGRVLVDDRINAYFLSTDVDGGKLTTCLEEQVGNATGCAGVTYTCGDMKTVHAGMGISMADFGDLAEDFSKAMDAHQVNTPTLTQADKDAVLGVLGGMAGDIVEDANNNVTTYQKLGRKPGIATVIGGPSDPKSFVAMVAGDATLVTFFAMSDLDRLKTCLVRQVTTATSGPQIYGKEVTAPPPADPGVTTENPCKDMLSSHKDLKDSMGVGIEKADFDALVGHLVTAMNNYTVPMAEQNTIIGALGPMCKEIVTVDPEMCG
ncbi:MAG TPA: hypothetical protein VGB85_21085 [Nannocystis sp.]|jgi:hemoglobin